MGAGAFHIMECAVTLPAPPGLPPKNFLSATISRVTRHRDQQPERGVNVSLNEEHLSVSRGGLIAGVLWLWVVALMASAWGVVAFEPEHWLFAGLLAATSCASSAVAAVYHLRTYAVRLCSLIRAKSDAEVARGVYSIR